MLARGNNGQTIFHRDEDYQRYLQLLATYARAHTMRLYHFVLMPNHVHLVLDVLYGIGLSHAMRGLNLSYSLFYRKRYRYSGHLWQGRFKSLLIDRDRFLLECGRFVELNPIRAALVRDPKDYAWSSARTYAEGLPNALLSPHPLYQALGASPAERQERYRQFLHDGIIAQRLQPPRTRYGLIGNTSDPLQHVRARLGFPSIGRRRGRRKQLQAIP